MSIHIEHSSNDKGRERASSDSMRAPTALERLFIDEMIKLDPRSAYPFMSKSDYARMMEEREKKGA